MRGVEVLSFEDIISQASSLIHDRAQVEIPWSLLRMYANDACREFARRTESVRGQATISFTSSFTTTRIPIGVVRITKASMVYSTYTYRMLLDRCEERDVQVGVTTTGMPTHWYVTDDLRSIGLYPAPSASGTLYIDCVMSGNEYAVIPITLTVPGSGFDATGGTPTGLTTRPDGWYEGCKLLVTSGAIEGASTVVKTYVGGVLTLEYSLPANPATDVTMLITDCPNTPYQFSSYLVQYVVARALQTLRPNDSAGAMAVFEHGVQECVRLIHPRVGFRLKRVREFSDIYEGC